MKIFLFMTMISISIIMYFLNNPLSMGMMILIQTLLTCLFSGMIINTYWFSYILFLTFLGGLLVLFIYVTSIASNELFFYSNNKMMMFFTLILFNFIINLLYMNNISWMNFNFNEEMTIFFKNFNYFNNENKIDLSKMYNNQNFMLMLMMIIYLFITLLSVIKITNIFYGPLRSNLF
uniref:NADH dehydrogenase subunit 6 n=1 Tax=Scythropia crataegella TaxID=753227 RepID=UPI002205DB7E|nr:NADH dehydrogenase subunit 6 [Scythropia crataegella]UXW64404.1 NADH dehydrogenase subunit 6 [Scythropia crataegella]